MLEPDEYDWSTFSLTFYYDSPLARVFRAWATADGLCSFFIETCRFSRDGEPLLGAAVVAAGDTYSWHWRHGYGIEGKVLSVERHESVRFTFGTMLVDVRFREVGDQTEVYLVQSEIAVDADGRVFGHLNCRSCWIYFMSNLQSVLHHGHDLRDKNPDRVSSMEVGYVPLTDQG